MRAFIALELPDALKQRLTAVRQELENTPAKVKWVEPENMHLTVRFLGDIDEIQAKVLVDEVRNEALHWDQPLLLKVGGLGAFPNKRRPKVIWVGTDHHTGLNAMAERMDNAAVKVGLEPDDRKFSAHLTLGRVKFVERGDPLLDKLQSVDVPRQEYRIPALMLIKSELTKQGPHYTILERVELGL